MFNSNPIKSILKSFKVYFPSLAVYTYSIHSRLYFFGLQLNQIKLNYLTFKFIKLTVSVWMNDTK